MQHVSHQTAIALRDAGFPQPEPAPGQVWYNHFGEFWITGSDPNNILPLFSISAGVTWGLSAKTIQTTLIFAPAAPDILRELGDGYRLCCLDWRSWIVEKEKYTSFEDQAYEYVVESYPIANDENPAEVCAKAWLEKNKPVSS